jgi:hypothetical protein
MEKYEKLKQLLENASVDVEKTAGGNKAAGVRVRKVLQEIIAVSKEFRKEISSLKNK